MVSIGWYVVVLLNLNPSYVPSCGIVVNWKENTKKKVYIKNKVPIGNSGTGSEILP